MGILEISFERTFDVNIFKGCSHFITLWRSGRFRHKSWIKWAKFKPHGFSRPLTASSSCSVAVARAQKGVERQHTEKNSSLTHLLSFLAFFEIQMQRPFYGNHVN